MSRKPIKVTRQDRIYCLKASSDYHPELCEECKLYPNCDYMTQVDMTEATIRDLELLEQEPFMNKPCISEKVCEHDKKVVLDKIRTEIEQMDFDFGDYYDHTDEIIEMVCKVIDKYKALE